MEHWRLAATLMLGSVALKNIQSRLKSADSATQIFIFGCILLILSASTKQRMMRYKDRLSSFTAKQSELAFSDFCADEHATAGFYQDDNELHCFHCSAKLPQKFSAVDQPDPLERHREQSPRCYLQKLLRLVASREDAELLAEVASDSVRFRRALTRLTVDLKSSVAIQFAESFGFSPSELQLAATRHFMQHGAVVPERTGDLIRLVHENSSLVHSSLFGVQVVRVLDELPATIEAVEFGISKS